MAEISGETLAGVFKKRETEPELDLGDLLHEIEEIETVLLGWLLRGRIDRDALDGARTFRLPLGIEIFQGGRRGRGRRGEGR